MTLSIHVITHKATDVVLAACTCTAAPDDPLALLVGDELPLADPGAEGGLDIVSFGTIAVASLGAAQVPGDVTPTLTSVLEAPRAYIVTRDSQGQAQGLVLALPVTGVTFTATKLSFTLPTAAGDGVVAWARFVNSATSVITDFDLLATAPVSTPTLCSAAINLTTGQTYRMLLLVTGCSSYVESHAV